MCYAKDEGGQRCFGHASTAYDRARAAIEANPDSDAAWEKLIGAEIDFASTPQGADLLREDVARFKATGVAPDLIEAKETIIQRGAEIRERNAAVRDAVRAARGKPKVAPGDPDVAYEREQAARAKRAAAGGVTSADDPVFDAVSDPAYLARQMGIEVPSAKRRGVPMHERLQHQAARKEEQRRIEEMHARAARWAPYRPVTSPGEAEVAMSDAYRTLSGGFPGFDQPVGYYMEQATKPAAPDEAPAVTAFRTAVTAHMSPELIRDGVMRHRAVKVLQGMADHGSAAPATGAVNACQNIKYGKTEATPENIRAAARRVAEMLEYSSMSHEDKSRWTQDMVRDLSGHEVRIARNPIVHDIMSLDSKYRYRVSVLS